MAVAMPTTSESAFSSNVFTKPTSLADGDILYIRYLWFDDTEAAGSPSCTGFTLVASNIQTPTWASGGWKFGVAIFRKVITNAAGEAANYTVTRTGGTGGVTLFDGGEIGRFSGADTSTPETDTGSAWSGDAAHSTTVSTGAAVDSGANDFLIMGAITFGDSGLVAAMTTPTGMTSDFDLDGGDAHGWSQAPGVLSGATKTSTMDHPGDWIVVWVTVKAASAVASPLIPSLIKRQAVRRAAYH